MEGDHKSQPLAELDLDGVTEVVKTRDDAFLGTQLEDLLRAHGIRTLVMVGVSTQSCIAATATHAYAANLHVVLAKDAIFTERPELHEDVLALLEDEYRFAAVPTDQIVDPSSVHVLTRDDPSRIDALTGAEQQRVHALAPAAPSGIDAPTGADPRPT